MVIVGDTFFVQAGLLLARQLREKEGDSFDIVVLCSEEIEVPAALREGLRIGRVTVGNRSLMPVDERIRIESYVRIFLPYLLPGYRRICYLDADMYLNRPGIAKLLTINLQGQAIAAVRDVALWVDMLRGRSLARPKEQIQRDECYFNAGLLVIDCAKYRELLPIPEILQFLHDNGDNLPTHDQSFLNTHFSHRYVMLPPTYNFPMLDTFTPLVEAEAPIILHFLGAQKPWYPTDDPLRQKYYIEYSAFLSENFGFVERENIHKIIEARKGKRRNYGAVRRYLADLNRNRKLVRGRRFASKAWRQQLELVLPL